VFVCDCRELFDVRNVEFRVADGFGVDGFRLVVYRGAQAVEISRINEADVDA
jgi:hypothetical protein